MQKSITLKINGHSQKMPVRVHETLLDVLREQFGLSGTKRGCDEGTCGACTVVIDGEPVLSCMTLAVRCHGKSVITIEGMAQHNGELHPLQAAAIEHGAVQCGFCTPGWLLSAKVLLENNPSPTRDDVRAAVSGHLCRCTGYKKIEDAILAVAQRTRENTVLETEKSAASLR